MKKLKSQDAMRIVRFLAAGSIVAMPIKACSSGQSSFAEIKVSEEAQSSYDLYEKIKEDSTFKSHFEKVLSQELGQDTKQEIKELTVKGVNFSDAGKRLEASKKTYNRGYKGSFGEQLKNQSKALGPVQAKDFQISQEILFDTLQANGDKNRLQGLLKKYPDDDYKRAFRATIIMKAYESLVREPEAKAALKLAGSDDVKSAAIQAGAEAAKTVITTLPDLIKNVNEGKWIDANGAALRACSKEIDTCSDALQASFNTKGQQNFNNCETENKPNAACNQGVVRDLLEVKEGNYGGYSSSFTGEGSCSAHSWRCFCAAAFEKRNGTDDYLHSQYDKYGCNWKYNKDKKPDRPEVANLNEALKVCEAKTKCSVAVSVGKTN